MPSPSQFTSWDGWRLVASAATGPGGPTTVLYVACNKHGLEGSLTSYENFTWADSTGTVHSFPGITTYTSEGNCYNENKSTGTAYANDATGYYMSVSDYTEATVYDPSGNEVFPIYQDPQGNTITSTSNESTTDELGRSTLTTTTACNSNSNQTCFTLLNSQGGTAVFTLTSESIPVCTDFGQSGVTEYCGNMTVVQSLQLPDGTSYQFTYDSGSSVGHYGELTAVTLPTSAQITYGYFNFDDADGNHNEWLSSYTGGGGTWSFTQS